MAMAMVLRVAEKVPPSRCQVPSVVAVAARAPGDAGWVAAEQECNANRATIAAVRERAVR